MTHFASPYQLNPFNYNPFREMLAEALDFDRVRRQTALKLFICATDVETAKSKYLPERSSASITCLLQPACYF
jgi:NTE family protein